MILKIKDTAYEIEVFQDGIISLYDLSPGTPIRVDHFVSIDAAAEWVRQEEKVRDEEVIALQMEIQDLMNKLSLRQKWYRRETGRDFVDGQGIKGPKSEGEDAPE